MSTTKTNKQKTRAWDAYRETADAVERLIGELEFRLHEHRIAARSDKDNWALDAELQEIRQHLRNALSVIEL